MGWVLAERLRLLEATRSIWCMRGNLLKHTIHSEGGITVEATCKYGCILPLA